MILLLGGTSETAPIASSLAGRDFRVLVSTATEVPLDIGENQNISKKTGRLSQEEIGLIIEKGDIRAIVDATHPYAQTITKLARAAATDAGIPFFRFSRPGVSRLTGRVHLAENHALAAKIAFGFGRPVFVTTGSRNLAPYADKAGETGISLIVRVLPALESVQACERAGILSMNIIAGKGPFSLEENIKAIKKYGIGVLVTKDSGEAGGTLQKLEAARMNNCEIVLVARPGCEADCGTVWSDVAKLVDAVSELLTKKELTRP